MNYQTDQIVWRCSGNLFIIIIIIMMMMMMMMMMYVSVSLMAAFL